jgi:hypothetical protein
MNSISEISIYKKHSIYIVWVFKCPVIDTIVRCIETALWEPDDITSFETTSMHSLEWTVPVERLMGHLMCPSINVT